MSSLIEKYKRLLFVGSFISFASLAAIAANKYLLFLKQSFTLTIALCSLYVFAAVMPLIFWFIEKLNLKHFVFGLLLMLLLFIELMVWVVLFHGFKGLPPAEKLHFFVYPFILFALTFVIFLFLPVRNGKDVNDG